MGAEVVGGVAWQRRMAEAALPVSECGWVGVLVLGRLRVVWVAAMGRHGNWSLASRAKGGKGIPMV